MNSYRPVIGNATVKLDITGNDTVTLEKIVEEVSKSYIIALESTIHTFWNGN